VGYDPGRDMNAGAIHGDTRDVLPRLLSFCLWLFVLACIFDPADKVLELKVYIFVLCWVITLAICLLSQTPVTVPRGLLIYIFLFILVPLYSIVWYWLSDGSARFEGFSMLKGYVLITLAPMLVLNRTDLLPRLCAVLTLLALAVIAVFILLMMMPELVPVLYLFGRQTEIVLVSYRAYTPDIVLLQVYFVTSPMLAIAIAYYFDKAKSARRGSQALLLWGLVGINVLGMLLAGTRNNILVSLLLPAVLVFYYARSKAVGALVSITAVAVLVAVFARQLTAFFDPSEASNSVKLGLLDDYLRLFSDPMNLIFGRGLGAYEDWEGRAVNFVTELTYLDMIRNFGLIGAVVMLGLLLFPVWHAFAANQSRANKAIAIAFTAYLGMCASNPNLFSSMGILILGVMLSAIYFPDRDAASPLGVGAPLQAMPADLVRTLPART
jgi:hypothetical protein